MLLKVKETKMEMEIISREKIKPNSPTPHHLKIYKFSLLDQIIPSVYTPVVLYFSSADQYVSRKIRLLKDSLSSTLTTFYPFAGVLKDSLSLDCNDEGLPFLVATVKSQLLDFLQNPDFQLLNSLLPTEFSQTEFPGPGSHAVAIQLNCFDCGGIALSLSFAHIVADLSSICNFLRCWGSNARDQTLISPKLNCIAQTAFPQNGAVGGESHLYHSLYRFVTRGKFVTRRYVFDAAAISSLKKEIGIVSGDGKRASRVELVTALIWKAFMEVEVEERNQKRNLLTHSVNLRRRARPPFPEESFGNFLWLAPAQCNSGDADVKSLVREVRRAVSRVDAEFMENLQRDDGWRERLEVLREEIPAEGKWFAVTSWSKVGLYDVDFGWGKPVWMSGFVHDDTEYSVMPNGATLVDTRTEDGIEAWVILDDKYVEGFENNEMIHKFAIINPPALDPLIRIIN